MEYQAFAREIERLEFLKRSDLLYDMPVGVAIIKGGHELTVEIVNREFLREEGYSREELMKSGVPYTEYIYKEDVGAFEDMVELCKERKTTESMEVRMCTKNGGVRWKMVQCKLYCYRDAVPYYVVISWDMEEHKRRETEERQRENSQMQAQFSKEVRLDPHTKVLNKVAAGEEINRFLSGNPEGTHVFFLIDIDDFKRINDTFGHTVGDIVIADIAQIIRNHFSSEDIVARVGGDEFAVFMKYTSMELASEKADSLCKEAAKRLIGDDAIVNVTLSIGLAVYHEDGEDYESLFETADQAMYFTKGNGKNNFSYARKGEGAERKERQAVDARYARNIEADKDFLNFAFSLLSHARDINGSLNVLIEQIGKKYGLDIVSVFEHLEERKEMVLMNYWGKYGPVYEKNRLPRTVEAFENAGIGEFVAVNEADLRKQGQCFYENWNLNREPICYLAGIKFEFSGNRKGCLYIGVGQRDGGFSAAEESTFSELARVVGVFVSLRNKLNDDQKEIRQLQNQDMLTGLYNLEAFRRWTEERLYRGDFAPRGDEVYALVHADINNFSYVNENFGQQVGDNVLQELGRMLLEAEHVLKGCRLYSDYFVELVHGKSKEEVYQNVLALNRAFEQQQKIRYPASDMRLSVGICFVRDEKESFETILEGANLARKLAKEQKGHGIVVYEDVMRAKRDDALHVTGRFYGALQKGEFELFLQPKFLLDEKKLYGAEALARWRTEAGEVVSPAKFIPPLENMGYIIDLDFYILEQLLRAMRRWKDSGKELFTVSTNFSRRHFENGGKEFLERLQDLLMRYQIDARYIEVEVTESVIVENMDDLKECLEKLKTLGCRIAIDDFGTGYSSLSTLFEIPADVVKIDKSFTDRISKAGQREFLTRMGEFVRASKEDIIYEGIETEQQREFLLDCGFCHGQGYLFDKPVPVEEFERKYI